MYICGEASCLGELVCLINNLYHLVKLLIQAFLADEAQRIVCLVIRNSRYLRGTVDQIYRRFGWIFSVEIMLDLFELDELDDAEFQRILHFKLHLAIMENDIAAVKQILNLGADPNFRNEMEFTAVEWADALRNMDILKVLLQDVDVPHNGIELLTEHIRDKHPAVVAVLLEMGVKSFLACNILLHHGLILLACHVGHVTVVSLLIRCLPWYRITPSKQIFLQTAAAAQNDDVLELLRAIAREEESLYAQSRGLQPLTPVYAPPRDVEFDRLFNELIQEDAYLP